MTNKISLEQYFAMCNNVTKQKNIIAQKPIQKVRKKAVTFEHSLQMDVMYFLKSKGIYAFAIPNGGFRSKKTARDLKKEGVFSGVADVFGLDAGIYALM